MRVLVTGASGFLGRHVVARLWERGHDVRALIRPASGTPAWGNEAGIFRTDLRSHQELLPALDGVDLVLHLAAAVGGDEDTQFASTVVGTERLLEAMARSEVQRLLLASSLVVYDWSRARGAMDEDTPLAADIYGIGGYSIAKYWQEQLVTRNSKARLAAVTSRAFFGRRGRLPSVLTPRRFEGQFKPLRFRNRRLREVLGWSPPLSFDERLARTYDRR